MTSEERLAPDESGAAARNDLLAEIQRTEKQATNAIKRRDPVAEDRSWVTRWVIGVFLFLLAVVIGKAVGWGVDSSLSMAIDLLKTGLLPVVTLILGFYFGQSSKNN